MEEIKIGFLRGIGFYLSSLFIGLIGFLITILVFFIINSDFQLPKKDRGKCISYNYKNGEKVCAKYENE